MADDMIYASGRMRAVQQEINTLSPTDCSVLITGETGTGKELAARAIHQRSLRANQPLVIVNIAALPENSIEAELFGVAKGAYTGVDPRPGRVFAADQGTLFLDEIGDVPLGLQSKLLRLLQEKEASRLGSDKSVKVNVRFLFATHKNLEDAVRQGSFRQDLFYRLSAPKLELPALRERPEDIPLLARHFCRLYAQRYGRPSTSGGLELSPDALRLLLDYPFPGNVRELERIIEAAVLHSIGHTVEVGQIERELRAAARLPAVSVSVTPVSVTPVSVTPVPVTPVSVTPVSVTPVPLMASAGAAGPPTPLPLPAGAPRSAATDELTGRQRPPQPNQPDYARVVRSMLIDTIWGEYLRPKRLAVLLQTHRGGGKSLARQIYAQRGGIPTAWLTTENLSVAGSEAAFFADLSRQRSVQSALDLRKWLQNQISDSGLLIVLLGTKGPEALLEQTSAVLRALHADSTRVMLLVVGGERLLRLREDHRYAFLRLLSPSAFFDVPDLTLPEVQQLLRHHGLPLEYAPTLLHCTGGHPWLLYELIQARIFDEGQATSELSYQLQMTRKLSRHVADPAACDVMRRLLRDEPVADLNDPTVRHEPAQYAESRLYFDGFLTYRRGTPTTLRCPAVRSLVSRQLGE